jgi:hypothetical protein
MRQEEENVWILEAGGYVSWGLFFIATKEVHQTLSGTSSLTAGQRTRTMFELVHLQRCRIVFVLRIVRVFFFFNCQG